MPTLEASNNCTYVTAACPVEGSPYGYYPSLLANTILFALWANLLALNLGLGVIWKTYSISANLTGGCVLEMIGYLGRMMLFENPYSKLGCALQIIAISMAPVLFLRTIYLILEQYMDAFSSYGSFLRREKYKVVFSGIDLISAYLSTLGFLLASGTLGVTHQIRLGNILARVGTIIQLFGLDSFACLVTLFFLHRYCYFRNRPARTDVPYQDFTRAFYKLPKTRRVMCSKLTVPGVAFAFLAIYVRCSYRFDLAMNRSNRRDQISFIVCESVMCLLAVVILTSLHPSYYFLQRAGEILRAKETTISVGKGRARGTVSTSTKALEEDLEKGRNRHDGRLKDTSQTRTRGDLIEFWEAQAPGNPPASSTVCM